MGAHSGPDIVTDGLVLAYDMDNVVKSFKGKPTENLVPDPLFTQQNWSTWSGRGADSWSYDTFSGETTVYTDLSINTGERHQLYKDITVSSSLTTFALSIDVYVTPDCDANSVFANQEYPFGNNYGSLGYDLTKKGTWQRLYAIRDNAYTGDTSNIETRYRFYFGTSNTTGSQGKIYFKNAQLEEGTFVTPFVNGTRSNTQALLDMSKGKNTITATSLTYNSDGTFEFDNSSSNYVDLPNDIGVTGNNVSAFAWFKRNGSPSGGYHIICGGQQLEISIPDPNGALRVGVYSGGTRYVSNHGSGLLDGNWHHIGFTSDGTTKTAYIDGESVGTQSISGTLSSSFSNRRLGRFGSSSTYYANANISIYQIYNKTLTAAEIKQNFNATRGRFIV